MKKAFILTYIPISTDEQVLIKNSDIFKLAINQHAEDLNPDCRIISDYCLLEKCRKFSQKIISVRDKLSYQSNRVIYPNIEFRGATIVSAVDYLILENYTDILIIGDNRVNTSEFQNHIKSEIDKLKNDINIYQYSNGNFNLPVKSIREFTEL